MAELKQSIGGQHHANAPPIQVRSAATRRLGGQQCQWYVRVGMHRIADLHPGEAKTDERDVGIITEADQTMPHLRKIALPDLFAIRQLGIVLPEPL